MADPVARNPLADTWWRAMSLVPVLGQGLAEQPELSARHPLATVSARRWTGELAAVQDAQVTYVREGAERTSVAMTRLIAAREPTQAVVAGIGLSLALATLGAAPLRAWLDALPKLQACCAAETSVDASAPALGVDPASWAGKTASARPASKDGQP
jgi:hypothetical protein